MKTKSSLFLIISCCLISTTLLAAEVTWNVSLWGKKRAFTEHLEYLSQAVYEKTNGEFVIKLNYDGGAFSFLDAIVTGSFEMAQFCASYHPQKNPLLSVLDLPMLPIEDLKKQIEIDEAVYTHPAIKKELARWNSTLFMSSPLPQYNLMGKGDPPYQISDLKDMRIKALGGIAVALEITGAIPVHLLPEDIYQALKTNTIDAVAAAPHGLLTYNIVEQSNWYVANLNPGTLDCPVVINNEALKQLPEKYARVLYDTRKDAYQHYLDNYQQEHKRFQSAIEEADIEIITYSDEELQMLRSKAAVPIWNQWAKKYEAKGLPGQELLNLVIKPSSTINQ